MNLSEAVELLSQEARRAGAEQFDIIGQNMRSQGLSVYNKKVQRTELSQSVGLGIRLFKNGAPGYASTEKLAPDAIGQTVKDALSHAEFTAKLNIELPGKTSLVELPEPWNDEIEALTMEQMATAALEVEAKILAEGAEIENIPHLGIGTDSAQGIFANSAGIWHQRRANQWGMGVGAVALRDQVRKMGVFHRSGRNLKLLDTDHIAKMAVERALELLSPQPMASGTYPVLFSHRITSSLVGLFLSSFHAEVVQKGQSRLAEKLGQSIAVPQFVLRSEPHRTDLSRAKVMDSEGIPTQALTLIEDGKLQNYLYHLESAQRDGTQSTGHGVRGFGSKVSTSFHNTVVAPGSSSADELRKSMTRGLEIVKLEGASGCSAVSGEISIGVQGFLIENGQRSQVVDGITLSTNFFDLLQQIEAISSTYHDNFSAIKVPDLLVGGVSVSA
ncbi:MAG: TldD/PmbA family protein [Fibrobacter sp.]|nr:TldD/PmbA family protein [Fibrobacter sp.]